MVHRDLNDMAIFSAIAQTNSITGAVEKSKLSNVSCRLVRLEKRLGVSLFEGNTRNNRLRYIWNRLTELMQDLYACRGIACPGIVKTVVCHQFA